MQLVDLVLHDHATTTAVHADVTDALVAQPFDQIREVLGVPTLVRADRQALHVLLQRRTHHLVDRTVVTEMDHLRPLRLQDAAHDVDRHIVPIEQARSSDEADRVDRPV